MNLKSSADLCLTRKEFTEKALDILNELRNQGQLCDAVIKVDGESFSVHRNILSASSAYFKALFTSKGFQPVPRQPVQEVEMVDVTKDIMRCLIDYAYSRQVLITEANVEQILHAADRFLKRQMCAENCLGIAKFARAYSKPGLEKTAMQFACSNFNDVVASSAEFVELEPDFLFELLSSDNLNVRNEAFVFEAVCKWIQHASDTRKSEIARMLRTVRLGFLSTQYLVERMKPHPYIRESENAKSQVIDAIKYLCKLELTGTQEIS
nr:hypothetical protein BaRGS_008356 [Batillaria attramentaria]